MITSGQNVDGATAIRAMLNLLFSFKGRISRRQYWLGFCLLWTLITIAVFPAIAASIALPPPHLWVVVAAVFVATFVVVSVCSLAMVVKRAHDFGNPGTWAFRPLSGYKLLFSEGEAHDNQYGTTAVLSVPSWRVFAGLGIVSLGVPCVVIYLTFFAGSSWMLPDCKPAVTAEGMSKDDAKARWREAVATSYGRTYANSGITIMSSTTCVGSRCTMSARPCIRLR